MTMHPLPAVNNPEPSLPQLRGAPFLTDGVLETTRIFHDGFDLPLFAAFPLIEGPRARSGEAATMS